jgi:hypothetical protein
MSFWPDDINSAEVISPREIMERAGDELSTRTQILTVSIYETHLADRIVLAFTVKNEKYLLELNLFEASHRLDQTYPVVIDPPTSDIPEFLRRERYVPGKPSISTLIRGPMFSEVLGGTSGHYVKNEWVCATPAEFTGKLKNLFALDYVKTRIISLQAPTTIQKPSERVAGSIEEHLLEGEQGTKDEDELEPPGETSE